MAYFSGFLKSQKKALPVIAIEYFSGGFSQGKSAKSFVALSS